MCKHEYKNFTMPMVLNIPPKPMQVNWQCVLCGKQGTETKLV